MCLGHHRVLSLHRGEAVRTRKEHWFGRDCRFRRDYWFGRGQAREVFAPELLPQARVETAIFSLFAGQVKIFPEIRGRFSTNLRGRAPVRRHRKNGPIFARVGGADLQDETRPFPKLGLTPDCGPCVPP